MTDFKEGLLQAANFNPVSLQAPDAWLGHLPFAAWLLKQLRPSLFVELGTHSGNSYFSFCQAAREEELAVKCYAVDTWQGDEHAGSYGNEVFEQVNAHNQSHYAGFSRLLRITFDDAVNYFSVGSVDLLHIDGLHTYEAVKHDFDTWLPKLAPGAVVLFHDINVRERGFGVWKLWEELQARYAEHHEFVHSHGLGVLRIGGEMGTLPWLRPGCAEQQQLRNYFAVLGARQLDRFGVLNLGTHLAAERQRVAERDAQLANLTQVVNERNEQLHLANLALIERSEQLHAANLALLDGGARVSEHDARLTSLNEAVAERTEQLQAAKVALAECEAQLAALRQEIALRNDKAVATWNALRK